MRTLIPTSVVVEATGSGDEQVALSEAKAQCEIEQHQTHWDSLLTGYIIAARLKCEAKTRRIFRPSEGVQRMDRFPDNGGMIEIHTAPVTEITSVAYIDEDGQQQTLDEDDYVVDDSSTPCRIALAPGASWPTTSEIPAAVGVYFTCGYDELPQNAKHAILLLVDAYYDNRDGQDLDKVLNCVDCLLTDLKWGSYP